MPRLIITSPDGKYGIFELTKSVATIGRGNANDLVLNHARVSRFHAEIRQSGDGTCTVADLGSTNGVLVNDTRITSETRLATGDRLRIGEFDLTLENVENASLHIARAEMPATLEQMLKGQMSSETTGGALRFAPAESMDPASMTLRMKKLERENYLLTVLYDAGKALHSKVSIDDIAAQVLELAFRIEGVERGFMMLFDEGGGVERQTEVRYRQKPASNEAQAAEPKIILSRMVLERMRAELEPILITDLSEDERFSGSESMVVSGLRSAMCAPLVAQNRLAGVLYVDNLNTPSAFTQEELNIFAVVATQAAAAIDNAMVHVQLAKQAIERTALERFLSPEVVEMVTTNPEEIRLGGVNQKVSILFSDIRGFTSLSERMAPEIIVELLNEYFTRTTEVIFEHGGTLDKYLGDGVMAVFGAPISKGDDAVNAVRAALAMQRMLTELARDTSAKGWPELRVGLGVNTGVVTAGNFGSPKRIDYTVIGDAVNVASRLCANALPGQVLISESTAAELSGEFGLQPLKPLVLKGKSYPLSVFSVVQTAGDY